MLTRKRIVIINLILIIIGGYFGYQGLTKENNVPRYVTAAVEKDTLIVSVSGSGQVSVSDQIDIKSKVSGDIVHLRVKDGQKVKKGDLLVQIDTGQARKAIDNAQTAFETAQLELEELLSLVDELTLLKAENSVLQARNSLEKLKLEQETEYQNALDAIQEAEENIAEGYEDAFNEVANAFFDLPTIISGLKDILYSYEISNDSGIWNVSYLINSVDYKEQYELERFIDSAAEDYRLVREKYDQNFTNYRDASRYSEPSVIEALLEETIETIKLMAEVVKSEVNMFDYWVDLQFQDNRQIKPKIVEYQSDLKSYTSKINNYISNLLSVQRTFQDNREAKSDAEQGLSQMEKTQPLDLAAAEISLEEKEKSLVELKAGPDELEIRAKRNTLQQKEDALFEAQENLAECYIRAPFDGVVAEINVKKGDSISSSAKLLIFASNQKIAEITLNEIDAAKIKIGQKANIYFDAVDGLNITGKVIEMDILGTVTQGVVNYDVKISFDTQDERVKPGMSLSAAIITDIKQDVLIVPNSAIKQQGDIFYAQVADSADIESNLVLANISGSIIPASSLRTQQVQVGLSNETMTEIISGLEQDDLVITQTISSDITQNQQRQNTGFNPGMMRMMR